MFREFGTQRVTVCLSVNLITTPNCGHVKEILTDLLLYFYQLSLFSLADVPYMDFDAAIK